MSHALRARRSTSAAVALGFLAAALLIGGTTPAESRGGKPERAAPVATPLGERIDAAIRAATGDAFWGAVLVARGDEVVLAKGYGYADYRERPNLPDTLFELASTSKQFTAAAILRLEQQRKLKTTDTLDRFFPTAPADKRKVTVDHLLHHTAGLDPELGVPYAWTGGRDAYVREMLSKPLVSAPGSKFSYSNVGYALLAAVVEVVARKPFEDYVREHVFLPAGLEDTGFIRDERLVASDRVSARRCKDCRPEWTAADWHWGWGYRGMGGVVSTVLDLRRWDRALRGEKVLGAEAKRKYYAPALEGYACGWKVETTDRGTTKASHSGGVRGYAVEYARWLEEDVVVAVLSNGESDVMAVERAATDLLFPPPRIEADLDATGQTLSTWRAVEKDRGLAWHVERDGGALTLRLRHEKNDLAVIRAPASSAARLAEELDRALSASEYPHPEEAPAMEGGLYLAVTGSEDRKVHLEGDLALRVLPRYEGRDEDGAPVRDPRAVLVLEWSRRGWPVMVKMNPAATKALLAAVRKT